MIPDSASRAPDTFTASGSESGDSTHAPQANRQIRLRTAPHSEIDTLAGSISECPSTVLVSCSRLRIRSCPRRRAEGAVYGADVARRRVFRRRRKEMEIDRDHETTQRTDSCTTTFALQGVLGVPAVSSPQPGRQIAGSRASTPHYCGVSWVSWVNQELSRARRERAHTPHAHDRLLYSRDSRDTPLSPPVFGRKSRRCGGLGVLPPAGTPQDTRPPSRDTPAAARGGRYV